MKLNDRFISYEADGERMLITTGGEGFKGLIRGMNPTAEFIIECLMTETTEEEILDRLTESYDAPREVIAADLTALLERLKRLGALTE